MFKRNEGILDRVVRVLLGLILLPLGLFLLGAFQGNIAGLVAVVIGAIGLITGLTGVCPTYNLFGINTLEAESNFMTRCISMMRGRGAGAGMDAACCQPGSWRGGERHAHKAESEAASEPRVTSI